MGIGGVALAARVRPYAVERFEITWETREFGRDGEEEEDEEEEASIRAWRFVPEPDMRTRRLAGILMVFFCWKT